METRGRLFLAVPIAGRVTASLEPRGALHQRIPLAARSTADVRTRGAIRFSKYLAGRSSIDLGVFGLVRVTPDPLRGRINLATGVAGRLAVRVAVAGRVSAGLGLRGDLRVPTTIRLYSRPLQVRVDPFGRLAVSAPPANDLFANAVPIQGDAGSVTGTTVNATVEAGEPVGAATVWWRWVAPFSGEASFDTAGSTFDTVLDVFTGSAVNQLTLVATNDDEPNTGFLISRLSFPIRRGTAYYLRVGGFDPSATGAVSLQWSSVATELASWSRDESQRFRIDLGLLGLLRVDIPPVPVPARFGGEVGVRTHRAWVVLPDPVIGPNGHPI